MSDKEKVTKVPINPLLERPGDVFEATLKRDGLIIAPGVYHGRGARTARELGFNAVYGGGWSISAMLWGEPDMGLHDRTEICLIGKHIIRNASPLPVIFDAETGFGGSVSLTRTVQEFHYMGVALAHLEDQDESATRRCGNMVGKLCVDPKVMVAKIRSWLATTKALNSSMRLMVRTDALTAFEGGIDNALDRAKRYMSVESGGLRPSVLWADAMIGREQIERWVTEMRKFDPEIILGINYSPNKDWVKYYKEKYNDRPPTYEELYDNGNGFSVIWHTILAARADAEATWNTFADMKKNGAEALWKLHERQRSHPMGDSQAMSGAKEWQKYEVELGGEEAEKRYDGSEGYKGEEKK